MEIIIFMNNIQFITVNMPNILIENIRKPLDKDDFDRIFVAVIHSFHIVMHTKLYIQYS